MKKIENYLDTALLIVFLIFLTLIVILLSVFTFVAVKYMLGLL